MSKRETQTELLEAGERILLEKGYNHTGLSDVLVEAGVPKGSFYYYFDSKEDFGLRVLERYAERGSTASRRLLGDDSLPPLERLKRYFESLGRLYEDLDWRGGCLMGNLGEELSDQNESFRKKLDDLFGRWREDIRWCLEEASHNGELPPRLDPATTADFVLNAWEGALLQMKVRKSRAPLDAFMTSVFYGLLEN